MPKGADLRGLPHNDPRVIRAVVARIKAMPIEQLQARLGPHLDAQAQLADDAPTTREKERNGLRTYEDVLDDQLRDAPDDQIAYLDAAALHAVATGNLSLLADAIQSVGRARGEEVNNGADLASIVGALKAMGYRLGVVELADADLPYLASCYAEEADPAH